MLHSVYASQDGGKAVQQLMEESKQSVEDVKLVVAQARRKPGAAPAAVAHFNEDDFMDGMKLSSPPAAASPTKK